MNTRPARPSAVPCEATYGAVARPLDKSHCASEALRLPVTGSLNASLAQWLLSSGRATAPYVASQGTALGRAGRVFIEEHEGAVWVGGTAVTCVEGSIEV